MDERQAWIQRCFPAVKREDWADWRWQLRNRVRDREGLERWFALTPEEGSAWRGGTTGLPLSVTPYYASLFAAKGFHHPLRKTMIPRAAEHVHQTWERRDPLGEEDHSPVPGLVHTYPDKVLFLVTDICATYCRYCTRSRRVGQDMSSPDGDPWEEALAYIARHPEIRDVLLSGGDPFVLADMRLDSLLGRLRAIPHVEIIRIGTKVPVVLPQRITETLCQCLAGHHPVWLSVHFTHPDECTSEVEEACDRLSRVGVPLMSQTVLLAGVNDSPEVMAALNRRLLQLRVKPYYLHQCDAVSGSAHFKTPVSRGLEIMDALHGWTTGYAVPHYMIDAPGGGGKIAVQRDVLQKRDGDDLLLRNYRGEICRYPDPFAG